MERAHCALCMRGQLGPPVESRKDVTAILKGFSGALGKVDELTTHLANALLHLLQACASLLEVMLGGRSFEISLPVI